MPVDAGVRSHPEIPPASFSGPVCTPSIPICSKASHNAGAPSAAMNDWPRAVTNDNGYAVNQTDAFSTAARGSGAAYGLDHIRWFPDS